jgi:hypothetical protein
VALTRDDVVRAAKRRSIHHQHIEQDDRRQAQDHRPDAERPKNVLPAKAPMFRVWFIPSSHDVPAFLAFTAMTIRVEF